MNILEIKSLTFSYKKNNLVLDDISFNIKQGEYVCLIGHNGSGKSTLAKLIMGLLEIQKGSIFINGIELKEDTINDIRKKTGIVFQNPDNQFIGSTVRDDIAFGLENRQIKAEDMDSIIEDVSTKVKMNEFLDKEPSYLSGGQKQRVAIAGVLAMKPELIILDEATAMLDPRGKKEITDLIHDLKQNQPNLTILSITHDEEEASLADKVIVLNQGKIVYNDVPDVVFSHNIQDIGLDLPFKYKIKKLLCNEGIDVSNYQTLEEVKDFLCR